MGIRKSFIIALCSVMAVSTCTFGIMTMAAEQMDIEIPNLYSALTSDDVDEIIASKQMPTIEYTDEQKQKMIEERIENNRLNATMTQEDIMKSRGLDSELEEYNEWLEEFLATEEGRQRYEEELEYLNQLDEEAAKTNAVILGALQKFGFYAEAPDYTRLEWDEAYLTEYICNICQVFREHKNELTAEEASTIENHLNGVYNTITSWFPQSSDNMTAYETIERTITVKNYNTKVERR